MSESESEPGGIGDEDLPEDVRPGEDNPLAEPPDPDEVDPEDLDLLDGGKSAVESEDSEEDEAENGTGDDSDDEE